MKQVNLPNLEEMTIVEAIQWYTGEVAKVFERTARINGTYSDSYKNSLYEWKQHLNRKIALERN